MFNSLSEKLESAFKHLKGQARINELNVANTLKDIRKALLDADVNFKIAKEFTDSIKEKAIGAKVINAISPGQLMVKIVQDELTALMGNEASLMDLSKSPTIILVAGLQGSGKTTFSGKLANYLKAQKKSPLLVAADIYRPAAMDQLTLLGEQIGVDVFVERENKNAVSIAQNALVYAKANNKNVIIIDLVIVSLSYVIRVLAGSIIINVALSAWLLICVFSTSLFLISFKRLAEIKISGFKSRPILRTYNNEILLKIIDVSAICSIIFYSLYTVFVNPNLIYTVPLIFLGFFRYYYLYYTAKTFEESPVKIIFSDILIIILLIAWLVTVLINY